MRVLDELKQGFKEATRIYFEPLRYWQVWVVGLILAVIMTYLDYRGALPWTLHK